MLIKYAQVACSHEHGFVSRENGNGLCYQQFRWVLPNMKSGFGGMKTTVKPVCNDHLYDKIYYLWFIQ